MEASATAATGSPGSARAAASAVTRVLIVPKWYPWPERPVFGVFCREQARAVAVHHDVIVLASEAVRRPGFRAFAISEAIEDGLRTIRVRYRRPWFRPGAMAFQIAGMVAALGRLRRAGWRPQVVHAHVYSAGLPALILARLSRSRLVISEHFTGFQRGLMTGHDRLTAQLAFRFADLVAPVSADLAGEVKKLQPRARVRVVANVVDTDRFHPERNGQPSGTADSDAQRPTVLLNVAELVPKKAHADLLEALAVLRHERDLQLEIVGGGALRGELERRVAELDLGGSVHFHGEQPPERVAELMRAADLFVLPSHFENLPCVLIEATASGLPWVATDVGGVHELAGGHGAGRLCPARDPAALAAAIGEALDASPGVDPEALADGARERFGFATIGRIWNEIYAELLIRSG